MIEKFFNHSQYSVIGTEESKNIDGIYVGYIPNGFEKTNQFESEYNHQFTYSKNDIWFTISKFNIETDINFDTEQYEHEETEINNIKYIMFYPTDNTNGVIWNDDDFIFVINGNCDKDEIMKIAKTVK